MNLLLFIQENFRNDFNDAFFIAISSLGDFGGIILIIIAIILLLIRSSRLIGLTMLFSMGIGAIITNLGLKPIFNTHRPCDIYQIDNLLQTCPNDPSFPSGHTTAAFAFATAVFVYNRTYGILLYILATLIGISRLYLFEHFPIDVLVGAIIGIFSGYMGYKILKRRNLTCIKDT